MIAERVFQYAFAHRSDTVTPENAQSTASPATLTYQQLLDLDGEINIRISHILQQASLVEQSPAASSLSIDTLRSIDDTSRWVNAQAAYLSHSIVEGEMGNVVKRSLLQKLPSIAVQLGDMMRLLQDREGFKPPTFQGQVVYTGKRSISFYLFFFSQSI